MHPILAKIDDIDAAIVGATDISAERVAYHRMHVRRIREAVEADLRVIRTPAEISSTDSERARQAAMQGDAGPGGYLPVQRALASGGVTEEDILARLAEIERRAEHRADILCRKIDGFGRALLHLAEHLIQQGNRDMSATTDAIKADLAKLEADVDKAVSHAAETAKDAITAEETDLVEIRQRLEVVGVKVHGMISDVVSAVAPAAFSSAETAGKEDGDHVGA